MPARRAAMVTGALGRAALPQVYPTLVIRGTGLYELWKSGLYRNYDPRLLVDLVARLLALVPPWVSPALVHAQACCSPAACVSCVPLRRPPAARHNPVH